MKQLAVLTAVALSAAFISFKAPAQNYNLNVSATIKSQNVDTALKGTVASTAFNEKSLYALITNAVAGNRGTLGPNITPVTLPANGYIAFTTNLDFNGNSGYFYVTNKGGYFHQLSGMDATNGYYSFMEFDSYIYFGAGYDFDLGYGGVFSDIAVDNLNATTQNGSGTGTSVGLLYIHDNPYAYDDADDPDILILGYSANAPQNQNAIEIRGIVTTPLKFTGGLQLMSSFSLTGTGNALLNGTPIQSLVSSGHMALTP